MLPIPLTVAVGILRGGRRLRLVRVDTVRDGAFYWNTARAVFAGVGAAFFVAGFPAVLALFAESAPPAQFATLVLAITLTRAPLLMPLSAIQSLLVVRFTRIDPARHLRSEFALLGIVGVVGLLGAVLGALIGPALLTALFGSAYQVAPGTVFALVIAATAIAWLYVTGPADAGAAPAHPVLARLGVRRRRGRRVPRAAMVAARDPGRARAPRRAPLRSRDPHRRAGEVAAPCGEQHPS